MSPLDGPDDAAVPEPEDAQALERRRRKAKRDFQLFLAVWIAVSVALVVIWALTQPHYFWPIWPILGMGVATAFLALDAYGSGEGEGEGEGGNADAEPAKAELSA
ncbi:MAG: 2TM domain-containing protein [Actinomycetales bacterium]|nr:2TM domain-containing protein [Actinomycetales bacterium]